MMKPRMTAERLCDHCGKSLGDEADGHVCAKVASELRVTKVESPSGVPGSPSLVVVTADIESGKALPVPIAEDDGFDPLIGTLLGEHYRIIERLGRGGMG